MAEETTDTTYKGTVSDEENVFSAEGSNSKYYDPTYYSALSAHNKELIFQAAVTMAAGFLSFDSLSVAGSGGGPLALAGRLGALQLSYKWLLYIAAKMAEELSLTKGDLENKQTDQLQGGDQSWKDKFEGIIQTPPLIDIPSIPK